MSRTQLLDPNKKGYEAEALETRLRQLVIGQDDAINKKLAKGYGSFPSAWRTLQGIETMQMINKGRVRWLTKGDAVDQAHFVASLFGIAA